ncbi:MAG: hypothetical protein ACR2HR_07760 [Euzebya sp.]
MRHDHQPSSALRNNARSVGIGYALALAASLVLYGPVLAFTDASAVRAFALALFGVGGILVVTGGNAIERLTTLSSSAWGISVNRHRDSIGKEYSDVSTMTSLGMAVMVGLPILAFAAVLLSVE